MSRNQISKSPSAFKHLPSRGFSLVEVLTVVALIAVCLALAAPPLRDMIQRNRVASQISTFRMDLKFARSEAMKRGQPVSICPSTDGTTCLSDNSWQNGWIVFYDQNASATIDGADVILRRRQGWSGGDTFAAAPTLTAVTFGRMGLASNLGAGPFNFVARASTSGTTSTQCVLLNQVGQQTVQPGGSGSCT
jgi:type IV fimbrial biogenesis protein FimT